MKKQSGFTLIELLLVLAIIGIISAIAIPALLGQRARARDKSAVANLDSVIADGIGVWDRFREMGSTPANTAAHVNSAIIKTHADTKNPWNAASPAYAMSGTYSGTTTTTSGFLAGLTATSTGQVALVLQEPATSQPGFFGGIVKLNTTMNGSINYRKAAAIE
jgi:type IV pilus assembly protein PilA